MGIVRFVQNTTYSSVGEQEARHTQEETYSDGTRVTPSDTSTTKFGSRRHLALVVFVMPIGARLHKSNFGEMRYTAAPYGIVEYLGTLQRGR
ncbi:hypothetical protein RRF57_012215 [Xylaria bambusicola]|uniref:Uncharacterized protein n=1 Tax=Xylaria bambusicola TaxID=326684 RepID=A0AAN7ZEK8_9PEZI